MILTITSLKGGTAKTTLTGLLALYLAQRCQKSVLLVELDPPPPCSWMGNPPAPPLLICSSNGRPGS